MSLSSLIGVPLSISRHLHSLARNPEIYENKWYH